MNPVPDVDKVLMQRLNRNDKVIAISLGGMAFTILALFVFMIYQNQSYLEQNRIICAKNHELTRQYIRCVATILTKPLAQRTQKAFDDCGIKLVYCVHSGTIGAKETNGIRLSNTVQ